MKEANHRRRRGQFEECYNLFIVRKDSKTYGKEIPLSPNKWFSAPDKVLIGVSRTNGWELRRVGHVSR